MLCTSVTTVAVAKPARPTAAAFSPLATASSVPRLNGTRVAISRVDSRPLVNRALTGTAVASRPGATITSCRGENS